MASGVDKMDLSLDQIIKLQRKESKQNQSGEGGSRGRGRGRGGLRGRGRGRGAARANSTPRNGAPIVGKKLGVRAGLAARRLQTRGRGIARVRGGRVAAGGKSTFQRVAVKIVKRAVIQNRRLAAQSRRGAAAGQPGGASNVDTRRVIATARRWRNKAIQLERVVAQQQTQGPVRLRRFNASRGASGQVQASPVLSNVKQRLGWRRSTETGRGAIRRGRGGIVNRGRGGQTSHEVRGRGNIGQMHSDLLMQDRRQQQAAFSRGRRQQRIQQARGFVVNTDTSFNRSPQRARGRGNRGASRFVSRGNDISPSFGQGASARPSLNERFGGSNARVRVAVNKSGFRGRGTNRQIFF